MVRSSAVFLALWASTASCLRIRSMTHSGAACPQDAKVTWAGEGDKLVVTLPDFNEALSEIETTACQLHMNIDQGVAGRSLVLTEVVIRGGLYMSSNAEVDFYTTAFWSEEADKTSTKQLTASTGPVSSTRNIELVQKVNAASPCIGADGDVGILSVNLRLVGQKGKTTFGRTKGETVSESLNFKWNTC